jgi:hypothetical protein
MRGTTTRSRAEAGSTRPGRRRNSSRWSRRRRIVSAPTGCLLTGTAAFAATNWIVGLNGGSNGQGQAATVANLSISATAAPSPANLLYPGSTGDVVISILNSNPFPVTITAVNLPTNTTYAAGYSDNGLTSASGGCTAATSLVAWNWASGASGTSHTLTTPLTVAASGQSNNPLRVTLTNAATMHPNSPNACQSQFFSMPSFTGVAATGGSGTPTTSPATSGWTN